ncbi:MAG: hypothetical protein ABSC92_09695 [Rhizomicrobium sp.]|jgi:hypothetical protein
MAELVTTAFVDGIISIGTHNNVHRVVFYRLGAGDKPEPALELIFPTSSLAGLVAALSQLTGGEAASRGTPPPAIKRGST